MNECWYNVFSESDVNCAYEIFINKIKITMNRVITKRKPKLTGQKTKFWATAGIRKSCATKRLLFRQILDNKVSENFYKKYYILIWRHEKKNIVYKNSVYKKLIN